VSASVAVQCNWNLSINIQKKLSEPNFVWATLAVALFAFHFNQKSGLLKKKEEAALPLTIILDSDLKVLGVFKGKMDKDFPQILWSEL